ncbi:phosphatidic acid phosphatase type 2/haloperoxidase [Gongronella butleri]|nr:phosphatidic acid phosphatase type 2/haloperoxidase [Gongronella butleri]
MVDDSVVLTSLSLTHVQFERGDPIAYLFAYITLGPIAIMVFYASVLVSRREVAIGQMLLGQLVNEVVNTVLKEYFQIARPHDHLGTGYGMPSSHSQFVWFFTTYGALYLVRHISLNQALLWKPAAILLMMLMSLLVCWSRIYLGYHSIEQVMAGSAVGVGSGVAWYVLMERLRKRGWVQWLVSTRLAHWLYLRDMRDIDNVLEWEYNHWAGATKSRLKNKNA